jgi:DNA replication protein DnaC
MHGNGGAAMSAVADIRPALLEQLKDLRLPTVRECYEDTARRAERETLSYEQYLLEVISRECEQRRKSKVQRLLKDSALPLEKSLQNFDLKRLPAKAARQLRTLLDGSFLDRKENVLVFGNPGSGKSHLLTALAQELVVGKERKMHFTKCALLMQDLLAAKRDLRLSREIKTSEPLRRTDHRRSGLPAAEPGRHGSGVHFIGRALRTWQRPDDQ